MSVLAVTSQVPRPLERGGNIRSFYLLRELARRFPVRLVARSFDLADLKPLLAAGIQLRAVPLRRSPAIRDIRRVARAAVLGTPYVCYARHGHGFMRAALLAEFQAAKPDILYLHHLDSFQLVNALPPVATVIDRHNVYSSMVSGGRRRVALKILAAFAAGLPVVSTPIGAEGIAAEDGRHLLLAPRDDLSASIIQVIRDRELAVRLAANARALANQQYDWQQIGAGTVSIVESVIRRS